ncbi:hypothetical protein FQN50_009489 [Emmonsiellopsis sp. PD_5]|nr:hypothetical protein FQN50_009489 [Emmonsiellopsis sp. PD_5]
MARRNRRLLRGETTYSSVKDEEVNILHRLGYIEQRDKFFTALDCKQGRTRALFPFHTPEYETQDVTLAKVAAGHLATGNTLSRIKTYLENQPS